MSILLRHLVFLMVYGLLGLMVGVATYYVLALRARPDLAPWHTTRLDAEFRAGDAATVPDIAAYRALEAQLFAQLDERVYAKADAAQASAFNRYWAGSRADARSEVQDWNRTVVLSTPNPRGAALLLHGLSDSPYSMRALAEHLHAQGWTVVALRLPGNGTAPLGLLDVKWQDWAAAVRLAARDLVHTVGAEKPFVLMGYSMGAALTVEYALAQQQGERLPKPSALVLLSPAIGVSSAARFASWQKHLARVPGLAKLAWVDLLPEYDPYKYGSFAVNAGEQIWRLTRHIDAQFNALAPAGAVRGLPPILAFQSVADATVSTPAVIDALYRRLAPEGHVLVLFDANRLSNVRLLLKPDVFAVRDTLLQGPRLPFDLTVVTNAVENNLAIAAWQRKAEADAVERHAINLSWPTGIFALSHIALPMAPEDPLYGATAPASSQRLYLGRVAVFGEKGMLNVPESSLLRLRYNPFFPYMTQRLDEFLQQATPKLASSPVR